MITSSSRKARKAESGWPRKITVGRATLTIYRHRTPSGCDGFLVANYAGDKRRLDSHATEASALEAASTLARQLSERDGIGASMTREGAIEFASAAQSLKPYGLSLPAAAATLAECLNQTGDVPTLHAALRFYLARHKRTTPKRVADVVAELLQVKAAHGASARHLADLRSRLERFARGLRERLRQRHDGGSASVAGGLEVVTQSYKNSGTVLRLFFAFCVARGYCVDNRVAGTEGVKVNGHDVQVFTPDEIARRLKAASPFLLPALAIGPFAGLHSAEIERLEWSDIHLAERFIVVGASKSKTASRRIVPVADNPAGAADSARADATGPDSRPHGRPAPGFDLRASARSAPNATRFPRPSVPAPPAQTAARPRANSTDSSAVPPSVCPALPAPIPPAPPFASLPIFRDPQTNPCPRADGSGASRSDRVLAPPSGSGPAPPPPVSPRRAGALRFEPRRRPKRLMGGPVRLTPILFQPLVSS